MTDLLTRFCWKLIYMYVTQWCMSEIINFLKIIIGSSKFMDKQFFANSLWVYGFDQFIVPIKLKYDSKYRHLGGGNLVSKFELQAAIYVTNSFLVAIVLHVHCTVMHYHTITHMHGFIGLWTSFWLDWVLPWRPRLMHKVWSDRNWPLLCPRCEWTNKRKNLLCTYTYTHPYTHNTLQQWEKTTASTHLSFSFSHLNFQN